MFIVNEDKSIYVTRGDAGVITVSASFDDGNYVFKPEDVVRMRIFAKKNCENVVRDFYADALTGNSSTVTIRLLDTKIGEVISKPTDYWYEVELNPDTNPQTIIGYDEDGAKVFKLFPEGGDTEDEEITKEDIPVVDSELDGSSPRPVENRVIMGAIKKIESKIENISRYITPEMYGAVGDGVTDDSGAFNRMFADHTKAHLPVLLSAEKYMCFDPVTDDIGHTVLPNSSVLVAMAGGGNGYLFVVNIDDARDMQGKYSYHLNLDCAHRCKGVLLKASIGNKYDIKVNNATTDAFCIHRQIYPNVYENDINVRIDSIGCAGERGLHINGNDNMFGNVVVINYKTAIQNSGNSHFKYVHCWLDRNAANVWENSVILDDITNTAGATIEYLYADTYRYGVRCENYANVHIGTYYALMNTDEVSASVITEASHLVFEGVGSVVIDVFETYQDYNFIKVIEDGRHPYITIKEGKCSDFVKTAPIDQLIFPCGVSMSIPNNIKYPAYDKVPQAIQDTLLAMDGGNVLLAPIHMGGTRGMIARCNVARDNLSSKIFVTFNIPIFASGWKTIEMT